MNSRTICKLALIPLFGLFAAGFFVGNAVPVVGGFGRCGGMLYFLVFTCFPIWSLAALTAGLAVLLPLAARKRVVERVTRVPD